jgi:hypothetical protein
VPSEAFVTVTRHVPALVVVSVPTMSEQPVAVPSTTLKLGTPLPEPPVIVNRSGVPKVPVVEVIRRADCVANVKVTVVGAELIAL